MKTSRILACAMTAAALLSCPTSSQAQGTAFTYQGRLEASGIPASGRYDFRFNLYDVGSAGAPLTGDITLNDQPVTNGLFTVTLDFGNQFPGGDRWLEIATRTNGAALFNTLAPRQMLGAAPYAVTARTVTGTVDARQLSGTIASANIGAGTITTTKYADGSITAAKIGGILAGVSIPNLDASKITSGTLDEARLPDSYRSSNVALRAGGNNFTEDQVFGNGAKISGASVLEFGFGAPGKEVSAGKIGYGSFAPNALSIVGAGTSGSDRKVQFYNEGGAAFSGPVNVNGVLSVGTASLITMDLQGTLTAQAYVGPLLTIVPTSDGFSGGRLVKTANSRGGSPDNVISNNVVGGFIGGGGNTLAPQRVGGNYASVVGGLGNVASGDFSTAMGWRTKAIGRSSTALGEATTASGFYATAMGIESTASGHYSMAMGISTIASGNGATAMGHLTTASGYSSTALGNRAKANHRSSFVWGDSEDADFASTAADQFLIRASGGVGIGIANPQAQLHLYSTNNPTVLRIQSSAGPGLARIEFVSDPQGSAQEWRPGFIESSDNGNFTGGLRFVVNGSGANNRIGEVEAMRIVNGRVGIGTAGPTSPLQVIGEAKATLFTPTSDRDAKQDFTEVNASEVLNKVAALPITEWRYKTIDGARHIGPVAQDFRAAFGLGSDDKGISTVDADGVALAAIQGLNRKVEEKNQESVDKIKKLEAENSELKSRLMKLEALVQKIAVQRE